MQLVPQKIAHTYIANTLLSPSNTPARSVVNPSPLSRLAGAYRFEEYTYEVITSVGHVWYLWAYTVVDILKIKKNNSPTKWRGVKHLQLSQIDEPVEYSWWQCSQLPATQGPGKNVTAVWASLVNEASTSNVERCFGFTLLPPQTFWVFHHPTHTRRCGLKNGAGSWLHTLSAQRKRLARGRTHTHNEFRLWRPSNTPAGSVVQAFSIRVLAYVFWSERLQRQAIPSTDVSR